MKKDNLNRLVFLFSLTYMVSYLTRINYGAVISEMVTDTGHTKQVLSLALTGSFITYGLGQVFSGILGDRVSPKKLVLIGLGVTTAMNLLLPFCKVPWLMAAVWSVNGLSQAFMWPPIVKIMVGLFSREDYNKGIVKVSWGSSIGTIVIYLLSPVIISFAGWRGVFFFSAACGLIMIALWQKFCPAIENTKRNIQSGDGANTRIFTPVFFVMALAIVVCGMLRDGVATWTPSLISESFDLSNSSGILSGAVLPVFGVLCYELVRILYRKKFKNPVTCAGIIYCIGILSSAVLYFALDRSSVLSVLSIALLNGTMHGVNLMLISMLPSFYANTGRVSTVSGVLNSFVYIGSAASTYGIAVLTEAAGWGTTVLVWLGLAALGTVICFATARNWKKM